jgi:hypothetical protein
MQLVHCQKKLTTGDCRKFDPQHAAAKVLKQQV